MKISQISSDITLPLLHIRHTTTLCINDMLRNRALEVNCNLEHLHTEYFQKTVQDWCNQYIYNHKNNYKTEKYVVVFTIKQPKHHKCTTNQ